jgi:hypothetical protein
MKVVLPNNWTPRVYQRGLWDYMEGGGKRAIEIAHRRWGKDDVCLHWTACAAHQKVASYWHMLPEQGQARKAIWHAINPHTGLRRIDEAFPLVLRETTRDDEMMIRFRCGSTWQVVGSDNFNSLIGSPPYGVVFSEWAISKKESWAYLSPILDENGGWALFITTPRGKNHAKAMLDHARSNPLWYAEVQSAKVSGVFSEERLAAALREYRDLYGESEGNALYEQEYMCSFEAAVVGAIYAGEMSYLRNAGRITKVSVDPGLLVHTAWDLGINDATAIWFYQVERSGDVRLVDYYENNGFDLGHYSSILLQKGYNYGRHVLPHDVMVREMGTGKTRFEMLQNLGVNPEVAPNISLDDGIQSTRQFLRRCWIDETRCALGIEALLHYHRHLNKNTEEYGQPTHDWSSHASDAIRVGAVAWRRSDSVRRSSKALRAPDFGIV